MTRQRRRYRLAALSVMVMMVTSSLMLGMVGAAATADYFTVTCHDDILTVTITDGEPVKIGWRLAGDDNTFVELFSPDKTYSVGVGGAQWVDVWITVAGHPEVDPRVECTTTTPTTTPPTSNPVSSTTVTTTTTTTSTVPPVTSTTTTVPPTTTSSSTSTSTVPSTTTSLPPLDCDPDDPSPPFQCIRTGVSDWTWPIGLLGASLLLGGAALVSTGWVISKQYTIMLRIGPNEGTTP